MRRFDALVLAVAMAVPATAPQLAYAATTSLPALLDDRIGAFSGTAGVVVLDARSGKMLYQHDADASVITASLYKLGVLVEAERRVDSGKLKYADSITVEAEDVTEDGSYEFPGTVLTLDEALEQMITISDNGAALALVRILGAHEINRTLAELKIQPFTLAEDPSQDNLASPRAIATLFTAMAQHALVSKDASDRMLQRLARQKINDRLPAQLPAGTVVAHKTGSLGFATHDAGVIYGKTGDPLVVVAMTWDSGEEEAIQFIQEIGSLVYANALASRTNVTYSVPQQPVSVTAGKPFVQSIRLTNLGPNDWRLSDPDPFTLVWEMSDASGTAVARSAAPLPIWDVPVGRSIDYPVVLPIPPTPGEYRVSFGLANTAKGQLASIGTPTAAMTLRADPPLLVKLGVALSPLLHRNEVSAALVTVGPLDALTGTTRLDLRWRLVDRTNRAVVEGSVPLGLARSDGPSSYLVPLVAPLVRGPFTLELTATAEGRVASPTVRKSIDIGAARTYPGEPGAGPAGRGAARP